MRKVSILAAVLLLGSAQAAVVDSQPNGFAITQTVHITAPPAKVYEALVHPELWWNSDHTFSQSAANLSMDAHASGCFCEKMPGGGSVEHATVVVAMPGVMLRLRGPLGPFQGQGADGALTFSLRGNAGTTDLTLDNNIGGYMKGGFGDWPQKADAMLSEQMARLKLYLETGKPEAK